MGSWVYRELIYFVFFFPRSFREGGKKKKSIIESAVFFFLSFSFSTSLVFHHTFSPIYEDNE